VFAAALALASVPALAGAPAQEVAKVGAKIPAFKAQAVALVDSHDVKVPTVYLVVGVKCSATPAYEKRFKALEDEFRSKGVDFLWVFPNKTETLEEKQDWMKKLGLKGPMIDDTGAAIAKALECKNTSQAILTDKEGNIVFRGGLDDNRDEAAVKQRFLADAIKETLAGKKVTTTTARVFG
jgi:alkyl hydroperoxide reductase subunit AhpC